jgi:hypothetical protein
MLELGRYLVHELEFEHAGNTLGRWMAHHLAELIHAAENAETPEDRLRAQAQATETILKIWEHRTALPGRAYPLAPYQDILQVLNRLRPGDNPFSYFGHDIQARREQLAAILFDRLTRLIIALLLMRMPSSADAGTEEGQGVAINALSETEQHILCSLQEWHDLFAPTDNKTHRLRKSKRKSRLRKSKSKRRDKSDQINLEGVVAESIDDITTTLTKLRRELQNAAADKLLTENEDMNA